MLKGLGIREVKRAQRSFSGLGVAWCSKRGMVVKWGKAPLPYSHCTNVKKLSHLHVAALSVQSHTPHRLVLRAIAYSEKTV